MLKIPAFSFLTYPKGGNGGISPICAAAAANKSASDIDPNVDDFDFLAGSG